MKKPAPGGAVLVRLLLAGVVLVMLAGCSQAPATLSMAEAKDRYLAIAERSNRTIDDAWAAWTDKQSLDQAKRYYAAAATAEQGFIDALKAETWPPEVAPDIDALVRANVVLQRTEVQASEASTMDEITALAFDLARQNGASTDLAAIVRSLLGLPPNT